VPRPAIVARITTRATELGFAACGIADTTAAGDSGRYEAWLAAGFHGEMAYLATDRHRERRASIDRVLPGARSVVCVALCYEPGRDAAHDARLGRIARYAAGEDYHRVMRDRLGELGAFIQLELPGARTLSYSDTGAILERDWAQRAGLGWIGKNTCALSPSLGSYFLLGEIVVDRSLAASAPFLADHCGTCTRCIDACPTGAIVAPHRLDARRCISYLTIELRGPIPRELRPLVGDWIFGCDVCQEVCPWNRFAPPAREARLQARALGGWTLERFLDLDDAEFRRLFETSPIRRAKRAGFLRNVCVALGNRRDVAAAPRLAQTLREDPEPLVRGHAAWALARIAGMHAAAALRAASSDGDTFVREEAEQALASVVAS